MKDKDPRSESPKPRMSGIRVEARGLNAQSDIVRDTRVASQEKQYAVVLDGRKAADKPTWPDQTAAAIITPSLDMLTTSDPDVVENTMRNAFMEAHRALAERGEGGTASVTAVKIIHTESGRKAVIGSIGNTRAYLFNEGGLEQITVDDSFKVTQTDEDLLQAHLDYIEDGNGYAAFRKRQFSGRMGMYFWENREQVSKSLGQKGLVGDTPPVPRFYEVDLQTGDRLLLTTDGVHLNLTREEIADTLREGNGSEVLLGHTRNRIANKNHVRSYYDYATAITMDIEKPMYEYDLKDGQPLRFPYQGEPLQVVTPDDHVLEVGLPQDLGYSFPAPGFLIIDRELLDATSGLAGYRSFREGTPAYVANPLVIQGRPDYLSGYEPNTVGVSVNQNILTLVNMKTADTYKVRVPAPDMA